MCPHTSAQGAAPRLSLSNRLDRTAGQEHLDSCNTRRKVIVWGVSYWKEFFSPFFFFFVPQEKLLSAVSRTKKLFTFLGNDAAAFHSALILPHLKLLMYEALSYQYMYLRALTALSYCYTSSVGPLARMLGLKLLVYEALRYWCMRP